MDGQEADEWRALLAEIDAFCEAMRDGRIRAVRLTNEDSDADT